MENVLIELARAFALMLVIEGILPFLAPSKWRSLLHAISSTEDGPARMTGLFTMIVGVLILYAL